MKSENVEGRMRSDSWHLLTFHGIGTERDGWEPISESEFARQMAEPAKLRNSGGVEVVTFKTPADHFGRRGSAQLEALCGLAKRS